MVFLLHCSQFNKEPEVKTNYLNNKDILKEIHKSKTTYCSYTRPEYADYDLIVTDVKQINKKNILAARRSRAERLGRLAHEAATADGTKRKLDEFEIKYTKIPETDVVFRVMTWEHVPIDDAKTRRAAEKLAEEEDTPPSTEYDDDSIEIAAPTKYVKCNFPPFQHYMITEAGDVVCVGKSHWQGALDSEIGRAHV